MCGVYYNTYANSLLVQVTLQTATSTLDKFSIPLHVALQPLAQLMATTWLQFHLQCKLVQFLVLQLFQVFSVYQL